MLHNPFIVLHVFVMYVVLSVQQYTTTLYTVITCLSLHVFVMQLDVAHFLNIYSCAVGHIVHDATIDQHKLFPFH